MKNIQRVIHSGDCIYACLSLGQRVLAQGIITGVTDLADLLARVRKAAEGTVGLGVLHVKSITRGWSWTRPLRLYPPSDAGFTPVAMAFSGPRFPWEL